ncbi:MAG TPA: DNA repair protein RadC [Gemmatimonadales bacterium]|nr:DNA repair protein RadC [Gemmatimonadales bacterium]
MPVRISETRVQDRPRERLLRLGAAALTTAELLAILIGTGRSGASAPQVAAALLAQGGPDLPRLARRTAAELASVAGIGAAKAARVVAALELGRRLLEDGRPDRPRIRSPADVYRWFAPRLADLAAEEFHVLALDSQSGVLRDLLVTRGILNSSLVHPREVFRGAIAEAAAGIIVVHNHPSGDPTPSADDRAVTRQLVEAGRVLDLPVYDHVVVGANRYVSFAEAGLL